MDNSTNRWRAWFSLTSGPNFGIFRAYSGLGIQSKVVALILLYKTHKRCSVIRTID